MSTENNKSYVCCMKKNLLIIWEKMKKSANLNFLLDIYAMKSFLF